MVYVGMDHGTTGISFAIMNDEEVLDVFKISREDSKAGKVSAIEELSKRIFFQWKGLKTEESFQLEVQVR